MQVKPGNIDLGLHRALHPLNNPTIAIEIRRDKRFKRFIRRIKVNDKAITADGRVNYQGHLFTPYLDNDKYIIFINEHRKSFQACEECQSPDGVKSRGGCYCYGCRLSAGQCKICRQNRKDCCC